MLAKATNQKLLIKLSLMAACRVKFFFCLVLILLLFSSISESRLLSSSSSDQKNQLFVKNVEEILKVIIEEKEKLGRHFVSKRLSPGGPDPRHHWYHLFFLSFHFRYPFFILSDSSTLALFLFLFVSLRENNLICGFCREWER